jgi:hypothetical protein
MQMNTTSRCYRFGQWLGRNEVKAVDGVATAIVATKHGVLEVIEGTKQGHAAQRATKPRIVGPKATLVAAA